MIDLEEFERRLRRQSSAGPGEGDPLAELARLVGGRQDPFDSVFNQHLAPRSPDEPAHHFDDQPGFGQAVAPEPANERAHPLAGNFAAIEAGLRGSISPEFADIGQRQRSAGAMPHAHAYGHAPAAEWDEVGEGFADISTAGQYMPPRSRRPLYITAAIILVGLGGIGATFMLKGPSSASREIAMIKAAQGPIKVQADAGLIDKPDQGASLLDKGPQPPPVALVNRVEQPVDLAQSDAQQSDRPQRVVTLGSAQLPTGAAAVPVPPPPGQTPPLGGISPPGIGDLIEPRKVKTVAVRPDGTLLQNDSTLQTPADTAPPVAHQAPATSAARAATPKASTRVVTTPKTQVANNQDAEKTAAQDPEDAGAARDTSAAHGRPNAQSRQQKVAANESDVVDTTAPGEKGSFAVQLAAPATEEQARDSMNRLAKQFGSALSGHHLSYHRATVADKAVYRVRVSGLSHDDATALCQKLQASGGTCFVAKN